MKKRMSSKTSVIAMVLLITVCFVPSMAGAFGQGGGERGKGYYGKEHRRSPMGIWRNPQMVEKLELTDGQVDQLRDLDFKQREKQQASRAELDILRLQMDKAFTAEPVDQAAVRQTAEKMAEVKGRMFVEKTEGRLALQEILTAEQIDKLQQYRMENRRKGGKRGYNKMKGQKWAQYQDCPRYSDSSVE